jgi:hypothetical protein
MREQQPFDQVQVMTSAQPQPGAQQHRIHLLDRGEHPARPVFTLQLTGERGELVGTQPVAATAAVAGDLDGERPVRLLPHDHPHPPIVRRTSDTFAQPDMNGLCVRRSGRILSDESIPPVRQNHRYGAPVAAAMEVHG